jgi:hypothetical protein
VFRVLRVLRLLRTIKHAKGLRTLLTTLVASAPALLNVGMLLWLVICVYGVVAMNMFKHVALTGVLSEMVNFNNFGRSILLLFRLSTAAGWNDVVDAVSIDSTPDCNTTHYYSETLEAFISSENGDCGSPWIAKLLIGSYVVVAYLVVVNMYIAVILDNLVEASKFAEGDHLNARCAFSDRNLHSRMPLDPTHVCFKLCHACDQWHSSRKFTLLPVDTINRVATLKADSFDIFYEVWQRYDPNATQFINVKHVHLLLSDLPLPLGYPDCTEQDVAALVIPLYTQPDTSTKTTSNIINPITGKKVTQTSTADSKSEELVAHCGDIIDLLVQNCVGAHWKHGEEQQNSDLRELMNAKLMEHFPRRHTRGQKATDSQEYHKTTQAARAIQRAWQSQIATKPMATVVFSTWQEPPSQDLV